MHAFPGHFHAQKSVCGRGSTPDPMGSLQRSPDPHIWWGSLPFSKTPTHAGFRPSVLIFGPPVRPLKSKFWLYAYVHNKSNQVEFRPYHTPLHTLYWQAGRRSMLLFAGLWLQPVVVVESTSTSLSRLTERRSAGDPGLYNEPRPRTHGPQISVAPVTQGKLSGVARRGRVSISQSPCSGRVHGR